MKGVELAILLAGIALCCPHFAQGRVDVVGPGAERIHLGTVRLHRGSGGTEAYSTIQAAVNAASEGDRVVLSEGVFVGEGNRDVLVTGKNLTITGAGQDQSIIDCQREGRGFLFDGPAITNDTVLSRMAIVNGSEAFGGGVYCSPESAPIIESCAIRSCAATAGGGVFYDRSGPGVVGRVQDCLLTDNAAFLGGGLLVGDVVVDRCVIEGNQADGRAGGVLAVGSQPVPLKNCVVANNTSGDDGGGVFADGFRLVQNCTVVGNSATFGGGISIGGCPDVVVSNTLVWGNVATSFGDQIVLATGLGGISQAKLEYCNVEGGLDGIFWFPFAEPTIVSLLDEDPLFAPGGEYRLSIDSPCVNAGHPSFVPATNEGDIEDQPRVGMARVDIGADELWEGMALGLVTPGRAGEVNSVEIVNAPPNGIVAFFVGTELGITDLSFGSCAGLFLLVQDATLLACREVDASGEASYEQWVPPRLAGMRIYLQVASAPLPVADCGVSNLVMFQYPDDS